MTAKQDAVRAIMKQREAHPDGPSVVELTKKYGIAPSYYYNEKRAITGEPVQKRAPRKKDLAPVVVKHKIVDVNRAQTFQVPPPPTPQLMPGMSVVIMVPTAQLADFFKGVMK